MCGARGIGPKELNVTEDMVSDSSTSSSNNSGTVTFSLTVGLESRELLQRGVS